MRNKFLFVLLLVALLFAAAPAFAFAQDTLPPPPGDVQPLLNLVKDLLVKAVADGTYLLFAVPLVVMLTAIAKKILPPDITIGSVVISLGGAPLALIFQVIVWVGFVVAVNAGYGDQFKGWVATATTILGAIFGISASSVGSTILYTKVMKPLNVPLLGYSRSASAFPSLDTLAELQPVSAEVTDDFVSVLSKAVADEVMRRLDEEDKLVPETAA